jgi:hypothetical protein
MPFPMAQVLAHVEVLVPLPMQVCQQPSMDPVQLGSGTTVTPPSEVAPSTRLPSLVPPSSITGSPGQNDALLARKHESLLSAQTPSMHAAPR